METKVVSEKVGFGVHTLSSIAGFDGKYVKELHMKNLFNEIIGDYKNQQVPPTLKEMAERFIYNPAEVNHNSEVQKKVFATVSTTALIVKPTKEVMFYERHLEENGDWKDVHNFTFKIE
ncbi:unnamed protein product [Arabis nemorensis]|uniref:Uncharacterized protein n=1 Tax=Arabis nemorensis TaxID=586526 RepID=A0A565ASZ3_9BRAS|nr:unnamed protein product [Arabis nemorensis]